MGCFILILIATLISLATLGIWGTLGLMLIIWILFCLAGALEG